jgi:hypothetical protein
MPLIDAADRLRRERLYAEQERFKAGGVSSFHCDNCDHYLPYWRRASYDRCWKCQGGRKAAYQRKYRAFRARAKAQGNRCPICKKPYEFPGGSFDYRRPCETKAGDMICTGCATVLRIVEDDEQKLLALIEYLSGVGRKAYADVAATFSNP